MKKLITLPILITAMSLQLFAGGQTRKVLVIGIDGTRADALQQANTPNIDSLVAHGFSCFDSWHLDITVSGPSWSSIMCGVYHNKHGVTGNSYSNTNYNNYPYFPTRAKEFKPNLRCIQYTEWAPMSDNVYNDGWDLKLKGPDGATVTTGNAAVTQLQDPDVDVLFTYFDAVDLTGHSTGFNPNNAAYINAIQSVDLQIGNIMTALRARPNYANEDWLVLMTTDHGGIGTGHGGNTATERKIWWIGYSERGLTSQISGQPDPGTYNPQLPVLTATDTAKQRLAPVQADIAVTAIHHLIYDSGQRPENQTAWNLDGKSWLCDMGLCSEKLVGINEVKKNNLFAIYPNPTKNSFTITAAQSLSNKVSQLTIIDQLGKIIYAEKDILLNANKTIDGANLQSGVYFIEIKSEEGKAVQRLIIE
jgi:hypothetical protein